MTNETIIEYGIAAGENHFQLSQQVNDKAVFTIKTKAGQLG